jgi:2-polyprenyl-3-methyl-5-hydroxy-6-metoxy-1,4-benzoquinol methylase
LASFAILAISVDYTEQQQFLRRSRLWGCLLVALLFAVAGLCIQIVGEPSAKETLVSAMLTIALGVFIYYTPDYLHLTVNPDKRSKWAVKIRWRILSAALVCSLVMAPHRWPLIVTVVSCLFILNWLAGKAPRHSVWLYLWIAELAVLTPLLLTVRISPLMGTLLLAASAHLAIVASDPRRLSIPAIVIGTSLLIIVVFPREQALPWFAVLALCNLLIVSAGSTLLLVQRAGLQNSRNIDAAVRELVSFKGYPVERIRELWAISNRELANNWKQANIDEHDAARMAEWYRQNSELYLFAISGYNLEYKRIRSNLNVLNIAQGACLDYGAGNGEILLELARRGHRVAYYDVDGETMRFARHRAAISGLRLDFFHDKDDLATAAQAHGFDTVFSLDVLEHMPDLKAELDFLSSLLNSAGLLVFDVPAGATKAHPMHLNHDLDVVAFLTAKGMSDERTLWGKLPFKKEEKYFFRHAVGTRHLEKSAT